MNIIPALEMKGRRTSASDCTGNLKALREHLPHVSISFDPFHIIKNVYDAVDEVRRELCKSLEKEEKKACKRKALLISLRGGESD